MKFFFDNCISPKIVKALRVLDDQGHTFQHLIEKFGRGNLKDQEWLPVLKQEGGWIIVSIDLFNKTKEENQEMRESGVAVFIFAEGHGQLPHWEQVRRVITWWPLIVEKAHHSKRGDCFRLPMTSRTFKPY